jgi:hypothetical protein
VLTSCVDVGSSQFWMRRRRSANLVSYATCTCLVCTSRWKEISVVPRPLNCPARTSSALTANFNCPWVRPRTVYPFPLPRRRMAQAPATTRSFTASNGGRCTRIRPPPRAPVEIHLRSLIPPTAFGLMLFARRMRLPTLKPALSPRLTVISRSRRAISTGTRKSLWL